MSVPYPTADDTPYTEVAILPDWGPGITSRQVWTTQIIVSRRATEQRISKRHLPRLVMEYTPAQVFDNDAKLRLENIRANFREVLVTPWWAAGMKVTTMASVDALTLTTTPIVDDWDRSATIYIWSAALGGQFRDVVSRTDNNFVLVTEGGSNLYDNTAFAFPALEALIEPTDGIIMDRRHETSGGGGTIQFRTL